MWWEPPCSRHLVEAGHEVRGLARVTERHGARSPPSAPSRSPGDVLDPASLRRLVAGADRVFHVAGVNEMCPGDPGHMDRVNIVGTCERASTRVWRPVCTGWSTPRRRSPSERRRAPSDRRPAAHRGSYLSRYERSKHISEQLVLEGRRGLEVVCVNPSSVQGPGRASGTGKLILDVIEGKLPLLVETTVSIVDIDDCAAATFWRRSGSPGERYLLSGVSLDHP